METLKELLKNISTLSQPPSWGTCLNKIIAENNHLNNLLHNSSVSVYGANTLTGHRDEESVLESDLSTYQQDLLNSHTIGSEPFYSAQTARFISYAKMYSWSAGMSGVSPQLFNAVAQASTEKEFAPRIPLNCSYSSGDVIPAAHWAYDLLSQLNKTNGYQAQQGEVMGLINGCFIQVGYGASLVKKIKTSWVFFVELTSLFNLVSQANTTNLYYSTTQDKTWAHTAIDYIKSNAPKQTYKDTQDPVSVRAIAQVLETFCDSIESYLTEIDHLLCQPSGNPLFDVTVDHPLSQASFLAPNLTIKSGALIESILYVMWSMVSRTNHLLSGNVAGIARDASNEKSTLGLIQAPKLMMSILEKSRTDNGRRSFSSGSQTSYGVEDLWSNGLTALGQVDSVLDDLIELCSQELHVINYISKNQGVALEQHQKIVNLIAPCTTAAHIKTVITTAINDDVLKAPSDLFIFK